MEFYIFIRVNLIFLDLSLDMIYNIDIISLLEEDVLKIAIAYASRSGTAAECARLLEKEFKNQEVSLFELGEDKIIFEEYDLIVLGTSIRMGKPLPAFRKFLKENYQDLTKCRVGYYICCGFVDCFDEYVEKSIPQELRDRAVAISCFGGLLDTSRVKGIDKLIVKAVRDDILGGGDNADQRRDMSLPTIFEVNIAQFANQVKESLSYYKNCIF